MRFNQLGLGDKQVLRDALSEFIQARTPVDDYITRRYGTHEWQFQRRKRQTVEERIQVANELIEELATK